MRFKAFIFAAAAASATVTAGPAVAHPDHDEVRAPASPAQLARGAVMREISQAKLPATWGQAALVETKARVRAGANQTVVSFRNDAEPNRNRRMLYVVVANGDVVSTGHKLN